MIAVLTKPNNVINEEQYKGLTDKQDIIVERLQYKELENEDGSITIKPTYEKVNLTKKVNETKKMIKVDKASETIAEIEKLCKKGAF